MLTSRSIARCLVLLSIIAVFIASAHARQDFSVAVPVPTVPPLVGRAGIFGPIGNSDTNTNTATGGAGSSSETASPSQSSSTTTTVNLPPVTTSDTSSSSTTTIPPNQDTSTTVPLSQSTDQPPSQSSSSTTTPPPSQPTSPPTSPSLTPSVTTGANGEATTVLVTVSETLSQTSSSSSQSASATAGSDQAGAKSEGISQSTIIGLSVSGGVALIGIAAFVIWKFTRKRFSDDDFDNEAIKWPDLNNTHGDVGGGLAPLPANRTGGAGFETSSQVNLVRPDSRAGSIAPSAAGSAADLFAQRDPYAVPPLPHLNPNTPYQEPYTDNPSYYDAYPENDPYAPRAETIPMNQMRSHSPGPQMTMGPGAQPQAALGVDYRARSPGPAASLYSGRASPGPQAGRMSPGPQMAYNQGGGY